MNTTEMTGDAGASASRTFRSIFGDQPHGHQEQTQTQAEGQPPRKLSTDATTDANVDDAHADQSVMTAMSAGAQEQVADASMEEEDEGMWSDDPPAPAELDAPDNNCQSGLQFAQRKSMEEWAEEDDEEDNWKDALQARVNQLELVFQSNNDAAAAESRRRFEIQQQLQQAEQQQAHQQLQRADFSRSLPASTRFTSAETSTTASTLQRERQRPASRHKMQRTSSSHACISGDSAVPLVSSRQQSWQYQHKSPTALQHKETGVSALRPRSTSTDFVARNIQAVDKSRKRSGSMSSTSSRTESPRNARGSRKNSLDDSTANATTNANGRRLSNSSTNSLRVGAARAASGTRGTAVFNLSDTEAIRRFVLDDVKQMSMERLVNDAQRLHFLEELFQHQSESRLAPSVTSSTAVAPPSPSSTSAMSLS